MELDGRDFVHEAGLEAVVVEAFDIVEGRLETTNPVGGQLPADEPSQEGWEDSHEDEEDQKSSCGVERGDGGGRHDGLR